MLYLDISEKRISPKGESIEEVSAHSSGTNLVKHAQFV